MDNYRNILKYRSHLMGVAIIWVILFHIQIAVPAAWLVFLGKFGYGGVDIFFFLSGIGVFYSLKKNSIEEFYEHRLKRIYPSYIPIIVLTFIFYNVAHYQGISLGQIINWLKQLSGNFLMVGWVNGIPGQFNWYVQAILWYYLLAPFFMYCLGKVEKSKVKLALLFLLVMFLQFPFLGDNTIMMTSRLFIYIFGMYCACSYENGTLRSEKPIVTYGLMVMGIVVLVIVCEKFPDWLITYGMYWFPFFVIIPGLCNLLIRLFEWCEGTQIMKGIEKIGKASFEIYLIHILVFDFILKPLGVEVGWIWICVAILSVIAGLAYKKVMDVILMKF